MLSSCILDPWMRFKYDMLPHRLFLDAARSLDPMYCDALFLNVWCSCSDLCVMMDSDGEMSDFFFLKQVKNDFI